MDYRIALSPELDVNAEELVSAWNTSSECQKIAKAETVQASAQSFFEPSTAIVVPTLCVGMQSGRFASRRVAAMTQSV